MDFSSFGITMALAAFGIRLARSKERSPIVHTLVGMVLTVLAAAPGMTAANFAKSGLALWTQLFFGGLMVVLLGVAILNFFTAARRARGN